MKNKSGFLFVSAAVLALTVSALAAPPAAPSKAKPCPKGTVATTSKATGQTKCFAMIIMPPGLPEAVPTPAKPAKKP